MADAGADKTACTFAISRHARDQLASRWPRTVLGPPQNFDSIQVPYDAPLIAYDSTTSAKIFEVPGTPMAAVVLTDTVVTFLTIEAAKERFAVHGFGVGDF